jgi:putative peptide zinc metalloprotease protein
MMRANAALVKADAVTGRGPPRRGTIGYEDGMNALQDPPQPIETAARARPAPARQGPWGLLMALAMKFSKLATLIKAVLLAASFGAYAVLFSWQFAAMIIVSLFVHENGHIWAMKRIGMRTRGIYFIPFLGAAAVSDRSFPSRGAEVFVAIMGPVWGLALAAVTADIYAMTGNPLWAAGAGWIAFINLFNLFPVNPLDGGRIVKSVAFSLGSWLGIAVMLAGFVAALTVSFWFGFGLLVFVILMGGIEFAAEIRTRRRAAVARPPMRKSGVLLSLGSYLVLAGLLWGLLMLMQDQPGASLTLQFLRS